MIGTIIVFALIPVVALIANAVEEHNNGIPFDMSYDVSGLPVVTLTNGEKEFNFLVDTGANLCVINNSILDQLECESLEGEGAMYGMEGNLQKVSYVRALLYHGKNEFTVEFQVVNLDAAFGRIEKEHKVTICGVLGTQFLEANRGKVDFIEHKLIYGKPKKNKTALKGQDEQLAGTV